MAEVAELAGLSNATIARHMYASEHAKPQHHDNRSELMSTLEGTSLQLKPAMLVNFSGEAGQSLREYNSFDIQASFRALQPEMMHLESRSGLHEIC
jgi:hypothetical protein